MFACTVAPVQKHPGVPLEETRWRLAHLEGKDIPATRAPAHLSLKAGRVVGFGGCNRLMGSYKLDGARLEFSAPATTLMACMGEIGQQEDAFLRHIPQVRRWSIDGKTLRLGDADGRIILEMQAEPPSPSPP